MSTNCSGLFGFRYRSFQRDEDRSTEDERNRETQPIGLSVK